MKKLVLVWMLSVVYLCGATIEFVDTSGNIDGNYKNQFEKWEINTDETSLTLTYDQLFFTYSAVAIINDLNITGYEVIENNGMIPTVYNQTVIENNSSGLNTITFDISSLSENQKIIMRFDWVDGGAGGTESGPGYLSISNIAKNKAPIIVQDIAGTNPIEDEVYHMIYKGIDPEGDLVSWTKDNTDFPSWLDINQSNKLYTVYGDGTTSKLSTPSGMVVDYLGNIYISDTGNEKVKKVTNYGVYDANDDLLLGAAISLKGMDSDTMGNIYVVDQYNHCVKKIDASKNITNDIVGTCGTSGDSSTPDLMQSPEDIYVEDGQLMFVTDTVNNRIVKSHYGVNSQITFVGDISGLTITPRRVSGDHDGTLYISAIKHDSGGANIEDAYLIKAWPTGVADGEYNTTILANTNNTSVFFNDVDVDDKNEYLYFSISQNVIYRIKTDGSSGTTWEQIAGDAGVGNASEISDPLTSSLNNVQALDIHGETLYFTDSGNNRIKTISNIAELTGTPINDDVGTNNTNLWITDSKTNETNTSFNINVTNTNDAPTNILLSSNSITENNAQYAQVGVLSSTDIDLGDTASYEFAIGDGDTDNSKFTIVGTALQLNISSDYESKTSYSIRIQVGDSGNAIYSKSFTIDILDEIENYAPTDITLTNSSITENSTDLTISTLDAVDSDDTVHTFTLVSGYGDNSLFTISGDTLSLKSAANYEAKSSYDIKVNVNDGIANFEKVFTISVVNVEEDFSEYLTNTNEFISSSSEGKFELLSDIDSVVFAGTSYDITVHDKDGDIADESVLSLVQKELLMGSDYIELTSGLINAQTTDESSFYIDSAIVVDFLDMKYVKPFTFFKLSDSGETVTENSYKNSPYSLSNGKLYKDFFNPTNAMEGFSRWYSLTVDETGIYKLAYKLQDIADNYFESGSATITYNLYNSDKTTLITSSEFIAKDSASISLPLSSGTTYYLELVPNSNLQQDYFMVGVAKKAEGGELYTKIITLDDTGNYQGDFIFPLNSTYTVKLFSNDPFYGMLYRSGFSKMINNNVSTSEYTAGLKASKYFVNMYGGTAGQEVILNIGYDELQKENESNDDIQKADTYETKIQIELDNTDKDFISFTADATSTDVIIKPISGVNSTYQVKAELLNASGQLNSSKIKSITSTSEVGFGFGSYVLNKDELYFIKLSRIDSSSDTVTFDVTINNTKRNMTLTEQAYMALYNAQNGAEIVSENSGETVTSDNKGSLIIISGDSDNTSDALYTASQKLALNMYKTFMLRGFGDDKITWHNVNTAVDVDGDGVNDSVVDDSTPSVDDLESAITSAISEDTTGPLYIYLVDHGANDAFKILSGEILYATEFKTMLDTFRASSNREVIVIFEACKSGSFTDNLNSIKDIAVLTSSEEGKLSYIESSGSVSFSKYVANNLLAGKALKSAYDEAVSSLGSIGMPYSAQTPTYFSSLADDTSSYVGGNFAAASMSLTSIDDFSVNTLSTNEADLDLKSSSTVTIKTKITSGSKVNQIYTMVVPPSFIAPTTTTDDYYTPDLTDNKVDMTYNSTSGYYEGIYTFKTDQLSCDGEFSFTINIEDSDGITTSQTLKLDGDTSSDTVCAVSSGGTSSVTDESLNISDGWNLVSLPVDTTISYSQLPTQLKNANTIWKYKDGWKAYGKGTMQTTLTNAGITQLSTISKGEGFWVNSSSLDTLEVSGNSYDITTSSSLTSATTGWHLLGTGSDTTATAISSVNSNISTIWVYEGKWKAYGKGDMATTLSGAGIDPLIDVNQGQGFWVNIK